MGQGPVSLALQGRWRHSVPGGRQAPGRLRPRQVALESLDVLRSCHWCCLAENPSAGTQQLRTGQHSKPFGQPGLFPPTVGREQEAPELGEGGAQGGRSFTLEFPHPQALRFRPQLATGPSHLHGGSGLLWPPCPSPATRDLCENVSHKRGAQPSSAAFCDFPLVSAGRL